MAEFVGSGPYFPDVGTAGVGVNNKALLNAAPAGNATTKQTSVNPATWQLFQPGSTASGVSGGTGASPSPTTGNDKGFNFRVADFDATVAAPGGLPANRVVVAGTVSLTVGVAYSGVNTANIYAALFYKRTSAGVLTFLVTALSASASSTTTSITFSTSSFPRTVFVPGDTLQVEFWVQANDVVAGSVHQTVTFNTGSGTNLGPTLRYEYPRSFSILGAGLVSLAKQTAKVAFSILGVGLVSFTRKATLARAFSVAGTGAVSLGKQIAKAPFSIHGTGVLSWLVLLPQAVLNRISSGGTPDWPLNAPTKTIAGQVLDEDTGAPIVGATVNLHRDSDEFYATTTVTDGAGNYSFTRGTDDPYAYHAYAYKPGTTELHGVTDRGLRPA